MQQLHNSQEAVRESQQVIGRLEMALQLETQAHEQTQKQLRSEAEQHRSLAADLQGAQVKVEVLQERAQMLQETVSVMEKVWTASNAPL